MSDAQQTAIASVVRAMAALTDAMSDLCRATAQSTEALKRLLNTPAVRRAALEEARGYRLPNWAWDVLEQQRRTFGSGNGRVMRE